MGIIVRAVEGELRGSGSIIGYRSMHQRLTTDHQLIVTRNIVRRVVVVYFVIFVIVFSEKLAFTIATLKFEEK